MSITLVGLGNMGRAILARLGDTGIPVVATSRSAVTRASVPGAQVRATPAESIAAVADAVTGPVPVLTSLPGDAEVDEVVFGPAGLLAGLPAGRRLLLIDLSTTDPAGAIARQHRLAATGHHAIDAPVSGGPSGARSGALSIMVGARPADLAVAAPLLAPLGSVVHCGAPGAGQIAKACNQLVVASTLVAVAEALTLARRHGLDPVAVRDALLGGYASSRVLQLQGESMLRRDFTGRGSAGLLDKDVRIVQRLCREAGLPAPVLDAAGQVVHELAGRTPGIDHSAVLAIIEEGTL